MVLIFMLFLFDVCPLLFHVKKKMCWMLTFLGRFGLNQNPPHFVFDSGFD